MLWFIGSQRVRHNLTNYNGEGASQMALVGSLPLQGTKEMQVQSLG